jgi:hypothetical protein
MRCNYQASDRMTSATDDDGYDDDEVILMIIKFSEVYLRSESAAVGPITRTTQTTYEILK